MPGPTLADKSKFLPAVLTDAEFKRNGVLFGENPELANDCKWVVVDPNRHKLAIWTKPHVTADYRECAKALNASVFTDGTLQHSQHEGPGWTGYVKGGASYGAAEAQKLLSGAGITFGKQALRLFSWAGSSATPEQRAAALERWEKREREKADDEADMYWFIAGPYGSVVGKDGGIPNTARRGGTIDEKVNDKSMQPGFFGRGAGTNFESYKIGQGEPVNLVEASGGLYDPEILKGKVTPLPHASNMWFWWGLAPVKAPQGPDPDGVKNALAAYAAAPGNRAPTGLIVGLYVQDKTAKVQLLADVGVTDAVRLDGGDSVLLGHGNTLVVGETMSHHKRVWLQYGFAFFKID
ncbi:MAG TPA: hypothetical protein VGQ90_10565 [Stellaceae bacterium]|jgi:hypothetical protein|nr:hypothetical protein [Stellaceae bacterium]